MSRIFFAFCLIFEITCRIHSYKFNISNSLDGRGLFLCISPRSDSAMRHDPAGGPILGEGTGPKKGGLKGGEASWEKIETGFSASGQQQSRVSLLKKMPPLQNPWGIALAIAGLLMLLGGLTRSQNVIYRVLSLRPRMFWGENVHTFFIASGSIIIAFGILVSFGIIRK